MIRLDEKKSLKGLQIQWKEKTEKIDIVDELKDASLKKMLKQLLKKL